MIPLQAQTSPAAKISHFLSRFRFSTLDHTRLPSLSRKFFETNFPQTPGNISSSSKESYRYSPPTKHHQPSVWALPLGYVQCVCCNFIKYLLRKYTPEEQRSLARAIENSPPSTLTVAFWANAGHGNDPADCSGLHDNAPEVEEGFARFFSPLVCNKYGTWRYPSIR